MKFMVKKVSEEVDRKAQREEDEVRQRRERHYHAMRDRWMKMLRIPEDEPTAKAA
jgi:hypothetical protein